jgi:4-amino-4-deoxy-L-arabinose transferase-like glycosyltransferase
MRAERLPTTLKARAETAAPGRGAAKRAPWLLLLVAAAIYAVAGLGTHPLTAPDEIRVAEIAREMAGSGELLVPHLGGAPFLEYPPLGYVAIAGAFRLLGVTDAVARLPSALATLGLLLLVFDMGRRLGGTRTGLLAAAILATTSGLFRYGHDCTVDAGLAFFIAAGSWAYLRLLLDESRPDRAAPSASNLAAIYAAAALAFWVKGPVGPAFIALPILVHALLTRRWALLLSRVHLVALPLFVLAVAAWPLLLGERLGPAARDEWWTQNVIGRVAPGEDYRGGHVLGPFYYVLGVPGFALPWSLALPFVVAWLLRRPRAGEPRSQDGVRRALLYLAAACALGLLLLSVAGTKRGLYALPLLAPLAVLTAAWISSAGSRARRLLERAAWLLVGASLLALSLGSLFEDPATDFTPLASDLASMHVLDTTAGFRASEALRAIVPFRTGILLPDLRDAAELEQQVAERPALRLLIEKTVLPDVPEAIARRLQLVRPWNFGRHEIGLYALAPAGAEVSASPR